MIHLDGSGTAPSGPSHGNVGVSGKYGSPSSRASVLGVAEDRVDLLGADDRHRHDRHPRAQRRRHEPAAAEPLQLVPLGERLADALEALGPHPDQLAAGRAAARRRRCRPASSRPCGRTRRHDRRREHQVGAEQPQVPARPGARRARASWVISASSAIVPEWLATTSAPPLAGTFSMPRTSTRNQRWYSGRSARHQDLVGQLGVEAELVDLVVAGEPAAQERQQRRRPCGPTSVRRRRPLASAVAALRRSLDGLGSTRLGRRDSAGDSAARRALLARGSAIVGPRSRPGDRARPTRCALDAPSTRSTRPRHQRVEPRAARSRRTWPIGAELRREAELAAQPGGVDAAAVGEEAQLLRREVDQPRPPDQAARPSDTSGAGSRRIGCRRGAIGLRQQQDAVAGDVERARVVLHGRAAAAPRARRPRGTNCSRGSKPEHRRAPPAARSTRDIGVDIPGPRKFANRSMVTMTSGRRRAKPRT